MTLLSTGCIQIGTGTKETKSSKSKISTLVTNKNPNIEKTIQDKDVKIKVLSRSKFIQKIQENKMISLKSAKAQSILSELPQENVSGEIENLNSQAPAQESLLVGFPMGLIGEQNIFGGVITKVSDRQNQDLGTLKLTDLPPLHVRSIVAPDGTGKYFLVLIGCVSDCAETSEQLPLISFPILGIDEESEMLILDLAPMANELNLVGMLDPNGDYTKLKSVSSTTTAVDYSFSTLVFDVATKMIPVNADVNDTSAPQTEFTVRWYLRLNSAFNPAFEARTPTEGVGFFETSRSKTSKITRFSISENGSTVHYYIKNVPQEFRNIFSGALDNWNTNFKKILGRELLTYEFIELDDPRYEELVPGDIRFNIIEWDLVNKAGYGGLGPSIANQFTGETISANVLIQGPTIVDLYTKWFGISQEVRNLEAKGLALEAKKLIKSFEVSFQNEMARFKNQNFKVKLGKKLNLIVHSQKKELEDPIHKGHFEIIPEGVTFNQYMTGYFTEMLEHEIGHNLGLRHNFKGNLGSIDSKTPGSVSRSIMEYLGRPYRHLNAIGLYDKMAISYGYLGIAPKHLNWFCTDEDQALDKATLAIMSPECSKSDATSDPFSYWEGRLQRVIDLLINTTSDEAPIWKLEELTTYVDETVLALANYGLSAEKTMNTWTNFFGKVDRPETPEEIKLYVLGSLKNKLCNPKLDEIIQTKISPEASQLAGHNLQKLRELVTLMVSDYELFTQEQMNCQ